MNSKILSKNRRSIRLKNFDYSQSGFYFITICTRDRQHFFGEIKNENMHLSTAGVAAHNCWKNISKHYPQIILDEFIIMPNHIHGILQIQSQTIVAQNAVPKKIHAFQNTVPGSISMIIRGFKIGVTKWFRANTDIHQPWQRNFHEHVIRNQSSLEKIRLYIRNNPKMWTDDCFLT